MLRPRRARARSVAGQGGEAGGGQIKSGGGARAGGQRPHRRPPGAARSRRGGAGAAGSRAPRERSAERPPRRPPAPRDAAGARPRRGPSRQARSPLPPAPPIGRRAGPPGSVYLLPPPLAGAFWRGVCPPAARPANRRAPCAGRVLLRAPRRARLKGRCQERDGGTAAAAAPRGSGRVEYPGRSLSGPAGRAGGACRGGGGRLGGARPAPRGLSVSPGALPSQQPAGQWKVRRLMSLPCPPPIRAALRGVRRARTAAGPRPAPRPDRGSPRLRPSAARSWWRTLRGQRRRRAAGDQWGNARAGTEKAYRPGSTASRPLIERSRPQAQGCEGEAWDPAAGNALRLSLLVVPSLPRARGCLDGRCFPASLTAGQCPCAERVKFTCEKLA
ncbi:translation initiation factor IF-2-like [Gallus gallus]|uniref:translation initiation factor IF-2-like n=1 Tax=Gallus gallus TaxID=9031 RepID=UPI001EFF8F55|nr:translation initiation factor IF-2-like [Gallus gallus]XP_046791849.1 translation initiation factor IF-2-like [Gallus gallus]